jgi:hypothetical protein
LGGFRLFQGVLVWARIDDEQKLAFPDKLVVVDFEFDDRSFGLRCNANQVRENFCVVGTWMTFCSPEHNGS